MSLPSKTILFLSTLGENRTEVSSELVNFLRLVKADLNESQEDFDDDFVSCLQESIRRIKSSRKMEERFMVLEEMLKEEREEGKVEGKAEGKAEALIKFIKKTWSVSDVMEERIINEKDSNTLDRWFDLALESVSFEDFQKKCKAKHIM